MDDLPTCLDYWSRLLVQLSRKQVDKRACWEFLLCAGDELPVISDPPDDHDLVAGMTKAPGYSLGAY